jgi:predicted 3-demethylubiquinone-9 3-methyltransferase (glyoxalase superfamily)/uncharacterized protein YndB with AHSA1/START domain
MPIAADAVLDDDEGRLVLRFERILRHPPERVWVALTELDDLRRWHPSPFELEDRVGGTVSFLPPEGNAFGDGRVTAYEPPSLLAYEWGDDHLRWEIEPHDGGARLILTHTFDDRLKAARDAAGWDLCLNALAASLSGGGDVPPTGESAIPAGWSELNQIYEERFGIAPNDATPPPNHLAASDAVAPLLMFTGNAEDAMRFYVSVFFPARIEQIERYGTGESGAEGTVKYATLRLGEHAIHCIDSPIEHPFTFTPSISLAVQAASTDAVDGMFTRLSQGGTVLMPLDRYPFSERFGWVTDRFGVSWQITLAARP